MKSGYVAIIGRPNVGKSTLLNRLVETKLSIVSAKPQTTRNRILGILTKDDCQCYFLDTPGVIQPQYELQKVMVDQIRKACMDADIILWVIDPWHKPDDSPEEFQTYFQKRPVICVINKTDLIPHKQLLPLMDAIKNQAVKEIIPVSALNGDGINTLKQTIFTHLPEGPFLYPEEDISDNPVRFFVAEIIREKVFKFFKKEIPYSTCVIIDEYKERKKGKDFIRAIVYVERKSQKGIIIGKNGETLKRVGVEARDDIERFTGRKVYLELWVRVKDKWRKNKKFLMELGY